MLKFQKKLTSSFCVFVPTRKRDAGRWTPDRILARLKSPFPYGWGIKSKLDSAISFEEMLSQ